MYTTASYLRHLREDNELFSEGGMVEVVLEGGGKVRFMVGKRMSSSLKGAVYRGRLVDSPGSSEAFLRRGVSKAPEENESDIRPFRRLVENCFHAHVAALKGQGSFPPIAA
jgi:hypothetical protein